MRILLLVAATLFSLISIAQENESFYLFKTDGTPTANTKEAAFLQHVKKVNDTCYVSSYYNFIGPMIRQETFFDYDLSIPRGRFTWYRANGSLDSSGYVYDGKKDGWWEYTEPDSNKTIRTEWYERGKLIHRTDYLKRKKYYSDGRVEDLDQPQDTTSKDSVVQVEAAFKGGLKGWKQYLTKTIKTPERFINYYRTGTKLTVMVSFRIEKDGSVGQVYINHSSEFSVDQEALRVISSSPNWKPATQDGKPVIYRQRQAVSFIVSE
jgi:hypothetical protein